jgi:hypothetical protein
MRWSSVWLVFSLCAYQPSLVAVLRFGIWGLLVMAGVGCGVAGLRWCVAASSGRQAKKNRRGFRRFRWVWRAVLAYALASPTAGRCEIQKYAK